MNPTDIPPVTADLLLDNPLSRPQAISASDWERALNNLPPLDRQRSDGFEGFTLSEPYDFGIYWRYIRYGARHWKLLSYRHVAVAHLGRACVLSDALAQPRHGTIHDVSNAGLYQRAHNGRYVRVVAIGPAEPAAAVNDYLTAHPSTSVLDVLHGVALLAETADLGAHKARLPTEQPLCLAASLTAVAAGAYSERALQGTRLLLTQVMSRIAVQLVDIDRALQGAAIGPGIGDAAVLVAAIEPLYIGTADTTR